MNLTELGYNAHLEKYRIDHKLTDFEVGRITTEHRERYIVATEQGELDAEIAGNLRFSARSREDFPAVGDWVTLTAYDGGLAIIHQILPRSSALSRQSVSHLGEVQLIATNIDVAFLVQAVDRDFNINRLERYLTICYSAKVSPLIVLTKIDLISQTQKEAILQSIQQRHGKLPVFTLSNVTQEGFDALKSMIVSGKTYCLLGSSGVGKSSMINVLSGKPLMQTDAISTATNKGRHITSHRELIVLEQGGILIDNPGMREVGIADNTNGLETTFDTLLSLGQTCRFKDCSHTNELGCAVIDALNKGEIDRDSYDNYLKMEREKAFFESTQAEVRKRDKDFGKMLKNYKKTMKKN